MTIYLLATVFATNPDSTRNQACGFHRKTFSTRFHHRASWPCGRMQSAYLASIIRFTSRQRAHRRTFTLTLPFCQAQLHRKVWLYVFLLKMICFLVTKMRGDENDEEIQELIAKTRKTLLKVIRHKLKQLYIEEQKTYPGQVLRDVHLEILKRNLTLLWLNSLHFNLVRIYTTNRNMFWGFM